MKLSIVATLYHSAPHINEFYKRATAAAHEFSGTDYEIVLVNDGSPDNTLELAKAIVEQDEHIVLIDLSRNFGHHKAMMTGLKHARGNQIFLIDSDLEEEPEWLHLFNKEMDSQDIDVVYGVQGQRKGSLLERLTGGMFYKLFRLLSGLNLPDNITVARLMTRRYVDALLLHSEYEVFMAGLWLITGFHQTPCTIKKHSTSKSTYTFKKKVVQLIDSVTSFSSTPLTGIFSLGCSIFIVSLAYTIFLILNWLLSQQPPSGYTSLMVSVWLLGGMIVAFIGVVGIYLSKIYSETKRRPYTIVRRIFKKTPK